MYVSLSQYFVPDFATCRRASVQLLVMTSIPAPEKKSSHTCVPDPCRWELRTSCRRPWDTVLCSIWASELRFCSRWHSTSAPVLLKRRNFLSTTPSTFLSTLTSPPPSDATLTSWSTGCSLRPWVGTISTTNTFKQDSGLKQTDLWLSWSFLLVFTLISVTFLPVCEQNAALSSAWLRRKSRNKPRTVMIKRRRPRESRSSAVSSSLECLLRCVSRLQQRSALCNTVFAESWGLCFPSTGVWSSGLWGHGDGGAGPVLWCPAS